MPSTHSEPRDSHDPKTDDRNAALERTIVDSLKASDTLMPRHPLLPESSFGSAAGDVVRTLRDRGFSVSDDEGEIPPSK